ncbi:MAG TPA: glycosyltransferase [Archangium sp.]|uniref:glycosyltransferase n=1 Tax=Archangium sp. TaxID=1872627 RepID=UPI002E35722F|nr:glycosyltransferase [Archangium sp.]HEX5751786.1 glycosyltransferase [Archangium sp.]
MATIVITPIPESGHLNPTLKLARDLRARGHHVIYCGIRDLEERVRAQGFEFHVVLEEVCPKGYFENAVTLASTLKGKALKAFAREAARRETKVLQAMHDGALDQVITGLKPDILICDILFPQPATIAHGLGVPTVLLNTSLPMRLDYSKPPMFSFILPDGRLFTKVGIRYAWLRWMNSMLKQRIRVALGYNSPQRLMLARIARRYGVPDSQMDLRSMSPGPLLPEIILCPREFVDFGEPWKGDFQYLEPSVDVHRQEPDFPWELVPEGKPLVYFSMGSMAYSEARERSFQEAALQVAARRPDWTCVLNVGRKTDPATLHQKHPNVIAVRSAPQLKLLQRACAMVNHGGFNTVKECIYFGVPMVVIPQKVDQPGISARVVFHGIGTRMHHFQLNGDTLRAALEEITSKPGYQQNIQRMQAVFREAEKKANVVDFVERLIRSPRPQATYRALAG